VHDVRDEHLLGAGVGRRLVGLPTMIGMTRNSRQISSTWCLRVSISCWSTPVIVKGVNFAPWSAIIGLFSRSPPMLYLSSQAERNAYFSGSQLLLDRQQPAALAAVFLEGGLAGFSRAMARPIASRASFTASRPIHEFQEGPRRCQMESAPNTCDEPLSARTRYSRR
jgi:hypothetical protein